MNTNNNKYASPACRCLAGPSRPIFVCSSISKEDKARLLFLRGGCPAQPSPAQPSPAQPHKKKTKKIIQQHTGQVRRQQRTRNIIWTEKKKHLKKRKRENKRRASYCAVLRRRTSTLNTGNVAKEIAGLGGQNEKKKKEKKTKQTMSESKTKNALVVFPMAVEPFESDRSHFCSRHVSGCRTALPRRFVLSFVPEPRVIGQANHSRLEGGQIQLLDIVPRWVEVI